MPDTPAQSGPAGQFCRNLFSMTEGGVFITRLANERGGAPERSIVTRKPGEIEQFIAKHDRPGFGLFLCTSTLRADATPARPGGSIRHRGSVQQVLGCIGDTDLKGVTFDRDQILAALNGLACPPSVIVWSGRGAQPYWLFNEALDADPDVIARVEALNKRIAYLIGGDPVHDVCRLLRLPGSHNTKEGGWRAVEVVHARWQPRYELADLEDWAAEALPVIPRRPPDPVERPASGSGAATVSQRAAQNVYELAAAQFGVRIPINIEARLAAMSHQGHGEAGVHNTQLAVSASLLSKGVPADEVVERLLAATRAAAGPAGRSWNWDLEERGLERMCQDWLRKHPPRVIEHEPEASAAEAKTIADPEDRQGQAQVNGDNISQISEARAKRERKERPKAERPAADPAEADKAQLPVALAAAVLAALRARGEDILFVGGVTWVYRDGLWQARDGNDAQWLDVQTQMACDALKITANLRLRSEVRGQIRSMPTLNREVGDVVWDAHGQVPTRSGLVHPLTGALTPMAPEHLCTWRVEADFDPAAECPLWLQMAADTFNGRPDPERVSHVHCLQEIAGAGMLDVKPRGLSKALCLVGGSNCGKSGILEVLSGLFGPEPISIDIEATDGTHGTMPFARRAPWVLHEAFNQSRWLMSSVVKAVVTAEPLNINVKGRPMYAKRVTAPVFWATNHPPQFKEATRAIVNRMIVLSCQHEFNERRPVGVAVEARRQGMRGPAELVLARERSGLLNWALAGLRRALMAGTIEAPLEAIETADAIHRDSNLVAGFLEEFVEFDPDRRVSVPDFCLAFSVWWKENKGEDRTTPSNEAIGRAVAALANPRLGYHVTETKDKQRRYYCGIKLTPHGREYWKAGHTSNLYEGKRTTATESDGEVNSWVPESWVNRPTIQRMRAAQAVTAATDASTENLDLAPHSARSEPSPDAEAGLEPTVRGDGGSTLDFPGDTAIRRPTPAQAVDPSGETFF